MDPEVPEMVPSDAVMVLDPGVRRVTSVKVWTPASPPVNEWLPGMEAAPSVEVNEAVPE